MGDINYGVLFGLGIGIPLLVGIVMISATLIDVMEDHKEMAIEDAEIRAAITKKPLEQSPEIVHYLSAMGGNASVPRRRKNRTRSSKRV